MKIYLFIISDGYDWMAAEINNVWVDRIAAIKAGATRHRKVATVQPWLTYLYVTYGQANNISGLRKMLPVYSANNIAAFCSRLKTIGKFAE